MTAALTRSNPTQAALEASAADRGWEAQLSLIATREAVRPLERRRQTRLAALVALTPICRRA